MALPITETWGAGSGTAWTIAQSADHDWTQTNERATFVLDIVSGEGQVDTGSSIVSRAHATIDGESEADVEVLTEFSISGVNDAHGAGVFLRRQAADTQYVFGIALDNAVGLFEGVATGTAIAIVKNVSGTKTLIGEVSTSFGNGDYNIRAQIIGTALKLKVWQGAEPGPWDLEETDSAITGTGEYGLGFSGKDTVVFDFSQFDATVASADSRFIRSNLQSRQNLQFDADRLVSTGLISAQKST